MMSIRGMNVTRKIMAFAAGLTALATVAGVKVALAQDRSSAVKIAVVDVQFLTENSSAGKNLRAQIDKMRADYQQEAKRKQDDIDKLSQSIVQERSKLSEDGYHQRMRELRQKVANYQSDVQEHQGKLDAAFRGASRKVAAAIEQLVDDVKKEQNFGLVLSRSTITGTPAVPDITPEVLKRLNQRTPAVIIDLPK